MNAHLDVDMRNEFRSVTKSFVSKRLTSTNAAYDPGTVEQQRCRWKEMQESLGLPGITIPERFGGLGLGKADAGIVFEEFGRVLAPTPLLATVGLAAEVLVELNDAASMLEYLPQIANGDLLCTLAINTLDKESVSFTASLAGGGWTVTGASRTVLDGHCADLIFVPALTDGGISLFAVESQSSGVTMQTRPGLDPTRPLSTMSLVHAPARLVGGLAVAWPAIVRAQHVASIYLASEMIGAAEGLLHSTVSYASERIQFGKEIGTFQAIQHRCADMYVDLELARSAVWAAYRYFDGESDLSLDVHATIAKLACSDTFIRTAAQSLQIHGGLGVTWEHFAHVYLKRAKASQALLGTSAALRERIATEIDILS